MGLKSATMSANVIQKNSVDYIISPIVSSERLNYRKKNGKWEKELLYP